MGMRGEGRLVIETRRNICDSIMASVCVAHTQDTPRWKERVIGFSNMS